MICRCSTLQKNYRWLKCAKIPLWRTFTCVRSTWIPRVKYIKCRHLMSTQRFEGTNIISGISSKIKGNYKEENQNYQNNGESSRLQEECSIASKRMFHIWINIHVSTVDESSPIFFNILAWPTFKTNIEILIFPCLQINKILLEVSSSMSLKALWWWRKQ